MSDPDKIDLDKLLAELSADREKGVSNSNKIKISSDIRIKKVAFDMYKVFGDQYDDLWAVETTGDEQFLVRSSHPRFGRSDDGLWSTSSDYSCDSVTLSYKNVPLCAFSSDEYGFSEDSVFTFKSALLDMANNDSDFINKVVDSQLKSKADAIKDVFPDLFKTN